MSTAATSTLRVRLTLRCLREDLGLSEPSPGERLDDVEHPLTRKAIDLTQGYPANLVRIQEIDDTMVFRFTHGRERVLTWQEPGSDIVWLCAVMTRREDAGYDEIVALHRRGELLPGPDDEQRLENEGLLAISHAIRNGAPEWLADARSHPNEQRRFELPGGAQIVLVFEPGAPEGLWLALPTLLAAERGLPEQLRALVIAALGLELGEAEFDEVHDWPAGELPNYELAYLWLS